LPPRHNKDQGLHQYKDGSWGIDCHIAGKRIRQKISPTTTKTEAREELQRLKVAHLRGEFDPWAPPAPPNLTLGEWLQKLIDVTPRATTKLYAAKWQGLVGKLYPEEIDSTWIREFVQEQLKRFRPSTVKGKLMVLGSAYQLAIRAGALTSDRSPFRDRRALGLPPDNSQKERFVTEEEEGQLVRAFGLWWVCIEFLILSGLRLSSWSGLRWEYIDWEKRFAMVPKTKSGKRHAVVLTDRAIEILRIQQERHPKSEWCFPAPGGQRFTKDNFRHRLWLATLKKIDLEQNFPGFKVGRKGLASVATCELHQGQGHPVQIKWKDKEGRFHCPTCNESGTLREYAARTGKVWPLKGLLGLRIHDLRHTAASRLAQTGASLYLIQQVLGQSSPQMAARYSHLQADHIRDAIEKANPPRRP